MLGERLRREVGCAESDEIRGEERSGTFGISAMDELALTRVLVVDDDVALGEATTRGLRRDGFVAHFVQPHEYQGFLETAEPFEALVLEPSSADGRAILRRASVERTPPVVIVVSRKPDLRAAVDAGRQGAFDYLPKPIDLSTLIERLRSAVEVATIRRRLAKLHGGRPVTPERYEATSAMRHALDLASRVARTPRTSALILGETGVGKERIAERIHAESARWNRTFIKVNMAALPDSMIEAELFGSVRGAYTGAHRDRRGLFATADGGTLLLDELCELRIDLQSKLLRVLESRSFHPVGSDEPLRVDVRVLAATNRDPRAAIAAGLLREDLYYRLSAVTIHVPPLRARPSEILELAGRFAAHFADELSREAPTLSPAAERALLAHPFPGNVRELRNIIERAMVTADGDILDAPALGFSGEDVGEVSAQSNDEDAVLPLQAAIEQFERARIKQALDQSSGDTVRAAVQLGVSRSSLYEKRKRYSL